MSAPDARSATPTASGTVTPAAAATISTRFSLHPSSADEQCVHQPHHDQRTRHGDPDGSGAAASALIGGGGSSSSSSSSSGAVADSTRPVPPPASRLYRHALESILAFSDLSTLAAAVRVSKEWLAAVGSMRPLELMVNVKTAQIEPVAASAIGRHVSDLVIFSLAPTAPGVLSSLAHCLPHLRRLGCMSPSPLGEGPLLFPAGLRELHLIAFDPSISAADVNAAIAAAGRLEHLDSLNFNGRMDPRISFMPLAGRPSLRRLTIRGFATDELTDAQVDELRALPRLHSIDVWPFATELLGRLLAQPHDLQWQQILPPWPLMDEAAALLPQLPSLTTLRLSAGSLTNLDFLQRLPNLTSLHCTFDSTCSNELPDLAVAGLSHCVNVTQLQFEHCSGLTSAHLAELLPRLPRLHSLTLTKLEIDSLSFLAQPPTTNQLHSLTLSECKRLPVAELRHLHALRGLRELHIDGSLNEQVEPDDAALMALQPPSVALPLLKSFTFSPRNL